MKTVAIYGVGLIGGSIGMALRSRQVCERVVGIGRSAAKLERAAALGAIDEYVTDVSQATNLDLVVLCAPVQMLVAHCEQVASKFPNALITDAGSTKRSLVQGIEAKVSSARFVGSHPLAGSDKSGVEHSRANLFEERTVIVTPTEKTAARDLHETHQFWRAIGAQTIEMAPDAHDAALAMTSHVPHVVAAALASATPAKHLPLIAGGWRDTTRIAAADVELWRQILQDNRQHVLNQLKLVRKNIEAFETALCDDDQDLLVRLLAEGKQRRDALGN